MERLIEASSNVGDTVLDPCMGSGAIGVAAKQCGRNFIGIEMNKEYFELTEERIKVKVKDLLCKTDGGANTHIDHNPYGDISQI